jgi:hypothetical protein
MLTSKIMKLQIFIVRMAWFSLLGCTWGEGFTSFATGQGRGEYFLQIILNFRYGTCAFHQDVKVSPTCFSPS